MYIAFRLFDCQTFLFWNSLLVIYYYINLGYFHLCTYDYMVRVSNLVVMRYLCELTNILTLLLCRQSEDVYVDNQSPLASENRALTEEGRLALHLFEDLTSCAGGGSVCSFFRDWVNRIATNFLAWLKLNQRSLLLTNFAGNVSPSSTNSKEFCTRYAGVSERICFDSSNFFSSSWWQWVVCTFASDSVSQGPWLVRCAWFALIIVFRFLDEFLQTVFLLGYVKLSL